MALTGDGDRREESNRDRGVDSGGDEESSLPPVLATLQAETLDSAVFDVERYVDQLAAMGHSTRFAVVYALGRDGEMPRKGLEEHTGCDGNNLQTHLDVLEDRGLVRKRRDPDDKRRRLYRLTNSGATLTDAVVSKMETDAAASENLTPMTDRY
jgi:DNA-binding MarR family transcriptional regulator